MGAAMNDQARLVVEALKADCFEHRGVRDRMGRRHDATCEICILASDLEAGRKVIVPEAAVDALFWKVS